MGDNWGDDYGPDSQYTSTMKGYKTGNVVTLCLGWQGHAMGAASKIYRYDDTTEYILPSAWRPNSTTSLKSVVPFGSNLDTGPFLFEVTDQGRLLIGDNASSLNPASIVMLHNCTVTYWIA